MSNAARSLWYVTDPMCSWCWGFAPVLEEVRSRLADDVQLIYVMGGLAPDSSEPMPEATRRYVQSAWDAVEARTGARFNRDFWARCVPRRSTWPACRAVLAAGLQEPEAVAPMFAAIQRAYYLEARNPSDDTTSIALAGEIVPRLDAARFERDLAGAEVADALRADFELRDRLGVRGFPALSWGVGGEITAIVQGYEPADVVLARLEGVGAFG